MAGSQESLAGFLARAKAVFQGALLDKVTEGPINFVTGNQSADLDSMSSAILYAYFASRDNTTKTSASNKTITIPVLSIPREDISIRPEFTVAFRNSGIDPKDLVTLSDFAHLPSESSSQLPAEYTNWILVDHNKLEGDLAPIYSSRVTGVIDHHDDEEAITTQATPRRIEVCGSCTSLVVDHFKDLWKPLWSREANAEVNAQIAKLALGSILIDTRRLKNESKTMDIDRDSAEICTEVIRRVPGEEDFKKKDFAHELDEAKQDVRELPLDGILRKDFKAWTEAGMKLGISSVVTPLTFLKDKARSSYHPARVHGESSWAQMQREFMEARGLDLHGVLAPYVDEQSEGSKKGGKGLLIRWRSDQAKEAVERFQKNATEELALEGKDIEKMDDKEHQRIWTQNDRNKTRKQIGPLLRQAIRGE